MITELFHQDPFLFILFGIFILFTLHQLIYIWLYPAAIAFCKCPEVNELTHGASIVIYAKNNYRHLKENLPLLLNQSYHAFEVVIVNDISDDDSDLYLDSMARQHTNLHVIHMNSGLNFFKGKKFPQSLGIRSAQYDTIIFTDVDCRPASAFWLRRMMSSFDDTVSVVLGYAAMDKSSGMLNRCFRMDNILYFMRFLGFAKRRMPVSGSARNIAFRKKFFSERNSFRDLYYMLSGDDDLFINRIVGRYNTAVQIHPEAHMVFSAPGKLRTWLVMKKDQMAGSHYYRFQHKFRFFRIIVSQVGFWGLFAVLLALGYMVPFVLGAFLLRMISWFLVVIFTIKRFDEPDLFVTSLFAELMLMLINPYLWLAGRTTKT